MLTNKVLTIITTSRSKKNISSSFDIKIRQAKLKISTHFFVRDPVKATIANSKHCRGFVIICDYSFLLCTEIETNSDLLGL